MIIKLEPKIILNNRLKILKQHSNREIILYLETQTSLVIFKERFCKFLFLDRSSDRRY